MVSMNFVFTYIIMAVPPRISASILNGRILLERGHLNSHRSSHYNAVLFDVIVVSGNKLVYIFLVLKLVVYLSFIGLLSHSKVFF